jgi:hypothetical protein
MVGGGLSASRDGRIVYFTRFDSAIEELILIVLQMKGARAACLTGGERSDRRADKRSNNRATNSQTLASIVNGAR